MGGEKYAREFLGKHAEERHLPPRMSNATAGSTPAAARHDFTFTAVGSRRRKVGSDNLAPPPTLPGSCPPALVCTLVPDYNKGHHPLLCYASITPTQREARCDERRGLSNQLIEDSSLKASRLVGTSAGSPPTFPPPSLSSPSYRTNKNNSVYSAHHNNENASAKTKAHLSTASACRCGSPPPLPPYSP